MIRFKRKNEKLQSMIALTKKKQKPVVRVWFEHQIYFKDILIFKCIASNSANSWIFNIKKFCWKSQVKGILPPKFYNYNSLSFKLRYLDCIPLNYNMNELGVALYSNRWLELLTALTY